MSPKGTHPEVQAVNIEQIMAEVREEIKAKGYTTDMLSFEDVRPHTKAARIDGSVFDPDKARDELENMSTYYYIQEKPLMEGGKIKVFICRLIRKFIRPYVQQLVNDQNDFNASATRYALQLDKWMRAKAGNPAPRDSLQACLQRIEALEQEVAELREKKLISTVDKKR